ncbi:MAG: hypothetical protein ACP5NZ_00610 [Nanobdellota archaeon]
MKEEYFDELINSNYPVRIIIPDDKTKELIANELETKIEGPIIVKGIIAANIKDGEPGLNALWYNMSMLKIQKFGSNAYNTGVYNSFNQIPSSITPARKNYKEGTGPDRFDMIVYDKASKKI